MKVNVAAYRNPLGELVADTRPDPEDIKREGWQGQHILVISPNDARLSFAERQLLCRIGDRLYGAKELGS